MLLSTTHIMPLSTYKTCYSCIFTFHTNHNTYWLLIRLWQSLIHIYSLIKCPSTYTDYCIRTHSLYIHVSFSILHTEIHPYTYTITYTIYTQYHALLNLSLKPFTHVFLFIITYHHVNLLLHILTNTHKIPCILILFLYIPFYN